MTCRVQLAFYKGEGGWVHKLIRWRTKSRYSHVEVVHSRGGTPDFFMYSSEPNGGVRGKRGWGKLPAREWDIVDVPVDAMGSYLAFKKIEGNGYDYIGVLFSRVFTWHVELVNHYTCIEASAYMLGLDPNEYATIEDLWHWANKEQREE